VRRPCIRSLLIVLAFLSAPAGARETPPDLILINGKIFTAAAARPSVQALAVRGERIVAIGESSRIVALAGPNTKRIDLAGRRVIPGINDAHDHLDIVPPDTVSLEFTNQDPTWADARQIIAALDSKAPPGALLRGDIGLSVFKDRAVNRDSLDRAAPKHAVILTSITGHAAILNSAALATLGFHDGEPDPMAGEFEKSPDGRLTGIIREYAVLQIGRRLADLTDDAQAEGQLREFFSAAVQFGITSLWRVRFEHGDGLYPDLVPRARALGIIVVQNPSHFAIVDTLAHLDPKQFEKAQPLRSLLAAGIPVALGSDGPLNPFLNILFAVTHPNDPPEAITPEQAVVAYTRTSAYAEFAEKDKGSLEPGKLADLAVLSRDIFQIAAAELPDTRSVLTLVGGKIVYNANALTIQ
jgi:predicted amidohydrolase YtcJ